MSAPGAPSFDRVNQDYQTYLGRPLTQGEYDQYWANKTDYTSNNVAGTPEAIAYNQQQGNPGPIPTNPDGSQVGTGRSPSDPPPGYHWDERLYMFQPNAPAAAAPPVTGGGGGGGGVGGGATAPSPGATPPPAATPPQVGPPSGANPGAPTPNLPSYTPPPAFSYDAYTAATPFSYSDFVAPDPGDLANDPWTQYTLKSQQDAINKSAAAKGVLNTGGTINDLLQNAQAIDSQGYQNLWNNKLQTYSTNRGNAFDTYNTNEGNRFQDYATNRQNAVDTYNTNYQTQYKDPFNYKYQAAQDTYNAAAHNFDQGQYYSQHNIDQNKTYDWNNVLFGYQQQQDQWANKFKLLGLV
jgi:hypothetical protein